MAPKLKATKERIILTALELVREKGAEALNARSLADRLSCSTQPIFSNFSSMDELRREVLNEAVRAFDEYMARVVAEGEYPPYKASGIAYIGFAGEESELFKLIYMSPKTEIEPPAVIEQWNRMVSLVRDGTGLDSERATLFHLEMWIFVHGIATMVATGSFAFEKSLVSEMLTDAFQGLSARFFGGAD